MILEQIAADTRLRLIEEKKLVSPEEMKEKGIIEIHEENVSGLSTGKRKRGRNERKSSRPCSR